jgi:hypothetical protein
LASARATPQPQALPPDFPRVRFALRAPVLLDLQGKPGSATATATAQAVALAQMIERASGWADDVAFFDRHDRSAVLVVLLGQNAALTNGKINAIYHMDARCVPSEGNM